MIDLKELKPGVIFYHLASRNNVATRKKIKKEIDGETWFRYDVEPITYYIKTYEVLGVLTKVLDGEWDRSESYELNTDYYIQLIDGGRKIDGDSFTTDFEFGIDDYYMDRSEAEKEKELLEKQAAEAFS